METCKYCGGLVQTNDVLFQGQRVHTRCAMQRPPDLVINNRTFHLELRTELVSKKQPEKILRKIKLKG